MSTLETRKHPPLTRQRIGPMNTEIASKLADAMDRRYVPKRLRQCGAMAKGPKARACANAVWKLVGPMGFQRILGR